MHQSVKVLTQYHRHRLLLLLAMLVEITAILAHRMFAQVVSTLLIPLWSIFTTLLVMPFVPVVHIKVQLIFVHPVMLLAQDAVEEPIMTVLHVLLTL